MVLECDGVVSSLGSCGGYGTAGVDHHWGSCGGCGTAGVVLPALSVRGPSVPATTATPEEMLSGRGMK